MSEKIVKQKKRGWASKIAHDLKHLDLERIFKESTFHSYPHTGTLDHVCMLFYSIDPCFDFTI
jgi:hypothetical protein